MVNGYEKRYRFLDWLDVFGAFCDGLFLVCGFLQRVRLHRFRGFYDSPTSLDSCGQVGTNWAKGKKVKRKNRTDEKVFVLTAYCPCLECCGKTDGITATGVQAVQGRTVAVDPSFITLGTSIEIDGRAYVAEDVGGAIKGNRIDVFFDTHEQALQFGRRTKKVKLEV